MTSGERAVWAAEFVEQRRFERGNSIPQAARLAAQAVKDMRALGMRPQVLLLDGDDEALAMLDDMLSTGADR